MSDLLNNLVDTQNKVKRLYESEGVLSIKDQHVHLSLDVFKKLFKDYFVIQRLKNSRELQAYYNGVKFITLEHSGGLTIGVDEIE